MTTRVWKPKYAVLHHSAGSESLQQLVNLRYYHQVVALTPDGLALRGSVKLSDPCTYATAGCNSITYNLCVAGNFEIQKPVAELVPFLVQIFASRCRDWDIPVERIVTHGWCGRNLAAVPYATACCGAHLAALLPQIRRGVARYL